MDRTKPWIGISAALAFAAAAPALPAQTKPPAAKYTATATKWEHEKSDLQVDPRFHFGSFANGLRTVWAQNSQPAKQVLLRLHVCVGSLVENRDELGLAHFLEHMAFNGSKSYKAGTLVPLFQQQGIRFGSDVNAHTSYEETVYELDLPDNEPKRLEKALLWMRDVVDGLRLEPKEIDAEKGVIDAEQDVRDDKGRELWFDRIRLLLDGSRYPRRFTIGDRTVRAKFDKKIVTGFYDRWYRPENCTFVMIGELGGQDPTPLLAKTLGDARGRGEWEEIPPDDRDHLSWNNLFVSQASGFGVQMLAGKVSAAVDHGDDTKTRSAELAVALACDMLEARLNEITPRPYVTGDVSSGDSFALVSGFVFIHALDGIALRLATDGASWALALQFAEREVRRALETGFTDEELKQAVIRLDQAMVPRPAWPPFSNGELMGEILQACNERYVPMEEKAGKELTRKLSKTLTKEQCLAGFKAIWDKGNLFICSDGSLDLRDGAKEAFLEPWNEATKTRLDVKLNVRDDLGEQAPKKAKPTDATAAATPPAEGEKPVDKPDDLAAKFAYARPEVAPEGATQTFDAIKTTQITFANGVRANVKFIEGGPADASFEVRFGEGMSSLDPERSDVARVADATFMEGGTAKNTLEIVRAALGAAKANVDFSVAGDACVFSGSTSNGEAALRRALEVVVAYLEEPAFLPKAFDDWKKLVPMLTSIDDRPTYYGGRAGFDRQLANGDRRFLGFDRPSCDKLTADDVKTWLASQLDGPLEVTVVGGIFADHQLKQVAATLGTLKARRARAVVPDSRLTATPMKSGIYDPRGVTDISGHVAHLHIVYPCSEAIDAAQERRIELFGDIVNDRMRSEIREKLGSSYSPRGGAWGDPAWKNRGQVELDLQVEPDKLAATKEACLVAMDTLAKTGVKKEEFERLRNARSGNPDEMAHDYGFWLRQLRRANRTPALYTELADLKNWYAKVTLDEINALAKQNLTRDKASILQMTPH